MGEKTTLTLAATGKESLRTTVPMSVVKQFNLTSGEKLDWTFDIKEGSMIVIIRPVK